MLNKSPENTDRLITNTAELLSTLLSEAGYSTDPRKQRETIASLQTGCRPSTNKSGADCYYFENGEWLPAERKSCTNGEHISGSYTGISVKSTWEEQVLYLKSKIQAMGRHYYDRFDSSTGVLVESWYLTGEQVFDIILPMVKKSYPTTLNKADPRLSASVCMTKIKQYGTQVI